MKNFIERLEKLKMTSKTQLVEMYNLAITDAIGIYNELHPSTEIPAPEPEKQANMKKAINLRTLEEFQEFTKVFNPSLLDISHWNMYQEKFSIEIKDGFWGGINSFTGKGYQILTYQEWVKENQPETTVIKFDYNRWKSGDYLRVVTKNGHEVKELKEFDADILFNFCGVLDNKIHTWDSKGSYSAGFSSHDEDLHLEIATPKPKEYWVNVFKGGARPFVVLYETEDQCVKDNIAGNFIKTIKFTI